MDKLLMMKLGLVSLEAAAGISGFVNWRKIKDSYWKWFPVYLLIIVMVELTGIYLAYGIGWFRLNSQMYMYFGIPIQFFFFFWLIAQYLKPYRENKWPLYGAAIYLLSFLIESVLLKGERFWFSSLSYTVGNMVLLVLILLFFTKFIKSEEILRYRSSTMFWVSLGLLVFYLGSFPFFALWNTLRIDYNRVFWTYWYIMMSLNFVMYIFFILAFIWTKPN